MNVGHNTSMVTPALSIARLLAKSLHQGRTHWALPWTSKAQREAIAKIY